MYVQKIDILLMKPKTRRYSLSCFFSYLHMAIYCPVIALTCRL